MSEETRLRDGDTVGTTIQPGRGRAKGHSIWWVAPAAILALAIGAAALSSHKHAPAEQGAAPISKTSSN